MLLSRHRRPHQTPARTSSPSFINSAAREGLSFGKAFDLKVELLHSQVIPCCPFDLCWNQDTTQQKICFNICNKGSVHKH